LEIEIRCGSLLEAQVQAIVNPANSQGLMGGGVAGVIKRVAGKQVEIEAMSQAPIPVGHAIVTSGGRTLYRGIIHAPTMVRPSERIGVENVRKAMRAALEAAEREGFVNLAIPGMGTGVGGVKLLEAAQVMMEEINAFKFESLKRVILIDVNDALVEAWMKYRIP
jgi:O-acetyl-ADP-ribose deacetylase (regulator of RNase III)